MHPTTTHIVAIAIEHIGYGCVACQRYHEPGDPLYAAHVGRQCKHGIERWTERKAFAVDAGGCVRPVSVASVWDVEGRMRD